MALIMHDTSGKVDIYRLEERLRTAWQHELKLETNRIISEFSWAKTEIMAWVTIVAAVMTTFAAREAPRLQAHREPRRVPHRTPGYHAGGAPLAG